MVFQVKGVGIFPVDMLRYDECWPATSDDATELACNLSGDDPLATWTIELMSAKKPTVNRWKSFGWIVKGA